MSYFNGHTHTELSNIRLLDCTIKLDALIDYCLELGLRGVAITDHESLSQSIEICKKQKELQEKNIDFKIAIGNEIYLTDTREKRQKYYHLILIAKDEIGHAQLRKLSSIAWYNSYYYGKQRRVPTLKKELYEVIKENPGHLICTTACRGSELGIKTLDLINGVPDAHDAIVNYMLFLKELFGDDLYIECAPNKYDEEQNLINKRYLSIAKAFNVKMTTATDAHYLKKEDRFVHEAFLNSKDGEREVADFYKTTYIMSEEEIREHLSYSFDNATIDEILNNTLEIMDKINIYDLHKKQSLMRPKVIIPEVKFDIDLTKYPTLQYLFNSHDEQEKFWVNKCLVKLKQLNLINDVYLDRLETEAEVIKFIGDDFGTTMYAYFNNLNHYINKIWEIGSVVAPSRGSACCYLSNYLMDITQIDSIESDLPYWRFLNHGNAGSVITTDIDIDLSPLARNAFISKMKEEVGEINCIAVGAFGTITTKSAVATACRGYRSTEFPKGIDIDTAQYMSSLIASERGFLWSLNDTVYGNPDKDRKPNKEFIREVNKYPGLLDIMMGIEGLVDKVTRHAAGVVITDNILDNCSIMRTPSGEIISCYSLYPLEDAGLVKYDFLVTDAAAKITECLNLLQRDGYFPKDWDLKTCYNMSIAPDKIRTTDDKLWDRINSNTVMNLFQFNSGVGLEALHKIQPRNVIELASTNAAMRLVTEKGKETPVERFARLRSNINSWYDELHEYQLSDEEIKILEPLYLPYSGCIFLQESLMLTLMDEKICNFSLSDANKARKVVAKKNMAQIPWLQEKIYNSIDNKKFADYVWDTAIKPQLSYAFSLPHCYGYGLVALQEAQLTLDYPIVYWNTACLNVNASTSDEIEFDEEYGFNELADENEEIEEKEKKAQNVNYDKIAKALGEVIKAGIAVTPPLINVANKEFEPDAEHNRILYSLKALSGVGDKEIAAIVANRPYTSLFDFLSKNNIKKPAVISLIKAGAFDELENKDRVLIMKDYIKLISEPKKVLNMRNFQSLLRKHMIPVDLEYQCRLFNFNKYIRQKHFKTGVSLLLDDRAQAFMLNNYPDFYDTGILQDDKLIAINEKAWKKVYDKDMLKAKEYIIDNQEQLLNNYNNLLFNETWQKYALGNISKWEMDSMSFYYHEHELANVNLNKYGISEFSKLPEEPVVESIFEIKNRKIPLFKIERIIGTCIGKNNIKNTFTLLTSDGEVVDIRLTKEHYAYYNKQISEFDETGTKKVMEKSWFTRGTKLMVVGIRRGSGFMAKKYKRTGGHRLYRILDTENDGQDLIMTNERWGAV